MNEPELKFKADDGNDFPEWRTEKITDIAETYIGLVTTMTEHYVNQGVPLIRNSDIRENRIVFNDPIFLDEEFAQENKQRQHKNGDVITVHTGDVGTSAVIGSDLEGSLGFATIVSRIKDKNIVSPQYLCDYFNSPIYKQIVYDYVTGDGRNNLNMKDFNKLYIPLPCYKEQQKIANLFSILDNVIDSVQKEVDSWEQMKRGVMQRLFSQEVRFKADDGSDFPEWEQLKVKDLFDMNKDINKNGDNKNVITNSAEFGLIPQRDFFDKDIAVEGNTDKYTVIRKGDFVYNPRKSSSAPYGPFNCYKCDHEGIVSPLYFCLRPKYTEMSAYLECYFASTLWHSYIYNNGAQGGARHDRVGMTNELLLNIPVLVPCLEEQEKIADCLSGFDSVIEKTKQKLEAYKQLEKGLMQRMFV